MGRALAFLIAALAAAPLAAQPTPPTPASAPVGRQAVNLFERDWVLMGWALKHHDSNRDQLLSPGEAERAGAEFRTIADGDGDGRVTPAEYRSARAFILARY